MNLFDKISEWWHGKSTPHEYTEDSPIIGIHHERHWTARFISWLLRWKVLATIGAAVVGIAGIISAYYAVRTYHNPPNPPANIAPQPKSENQSPKLTDKNPNKRDSNKVVNSQSPPIQVKPAEVAKAVPLQSAEKNVAVTSYGQRGGITAETVTINLEQQSKVIQSIFGNIECVFSGNWNKHPGDIVPLGWGKGQAYARIFESNESETEAILFLLENQSMAKLPDGNLKVNMEVRAKTGVGPLGQEIAVLKKYAHLKVYVPFIHHDATVDNRITLVMLNASFYVNGAKKSQINETSTLEIPIPKDKAIGFQLNKPGLFTF